MKILGVPVIFHISIAMYFIFIPVYKKDVIKLCTQCKNCVNPKCGDKFYRSVLILVPVRLGSEGLNTIYTPCLQVSVSHVSRIDLVFSQQPTNRLSVFDHFMGLARKRLRPYFISMMESSGENNFARKFFSLKTLTIDI